MVKLIIPRVPDRIYELRSALSGWLFHLGDWLQWVSFCIGAVLIGGYMVEMSEDEHTVSED